MNLSLPIDTLLPGLLQALDQHSSAVVIAQPGAGKTTRVPPAFLKAAYLNGKEIWVLQPRRLAAKLAALRVAEEMNEKAGDQVGYQFRFEKIVGPKTRLRFLTDGMLLPLALEDPALKKVGLVILDEFHERSLELELGLAWLRRLQQTTRPDLKLLVMSATLDAEALSSYLDKAPIFNSEGRLFPIQIEYFPQPEQHDLSLKVKGAIRHLAQKGIQGTTLVFLPGLGEIRQCQKALTQEKAEVHALYGALSVEEQQQVLKPTTGSKVILSTNVAETSLTVPGVTAVVDAGLTRQSRVSGWSGLQTLVTVPASQASSTQRAGRAGRLQEGTCLRLFTKYDFDHRAAFDLPELLRADLSKSLLDLLNLGVTDFKTFPWFLTPSDSSIDSALNLLKKLHAVDAQSRLTEIGRRMANLPLAPRLARFLLEVEKNAGSNKTLLRWACRLATYISEEKMGAEDLLEDLKRYAPGYEAAKLDEKLAGLLKVGGVLVGGKPDTATQSALAFGLLAAFPDRVAQTRPQNKKELLISAGGTANGTDEILLRHHDYFVVIEAQEVSYGGRGPKDPVRTQVKARSLCPIEETWLLDLFPDDLKDETVCQWNAKSQRVEGFKRLQYGLLVLDEKVLGPQDWPLEAQTLLLKEALSAGTQAYSDPEELAGFLNRARFVRERAKDFPIFDEERVQKTLGELCQTCRSFNALKEANLAAALRAQLTPQEQSLLDRLAPSQILLAGRRVAIHYDPGKPPWAESRIQDFFGMKRGPMVGGGEVPVVLHLLSPRQQPLQVTSDLAGFWVNHYPQIRKEMMRRYPRHKWPENPVV